MTRKKFVKGLMARGIQKRVCNDFIRFVTDGYNERFKYSSIYHNLEKDLAFQFWVDKDFVIAAMSPNKLEIFRIKT